MKITYKELPGYIRSMHRDEQSEGRVLYCKQHGYIYTVRTTSSDGKRTYDITWVQEKGEWRYIQKQVPLKKGK